MMDGKQRVMWSLEIIPESAVPEFALNAPNENMFQISFPDYHAAQLFVAEMQRFLGKLMLRQGELSEKRVAEMVIEEINKSFRVSTRAGFR